MDVYQSFLESHPRVQKSHYDSTAPNLTEQGIYRDTGRYRLSVRLVRIGYPSIVADRVRTAGAKDVLEIGPAEGTFARALLELLPDVSYTTVDFSEEHTKLQKQILGDYVRQGKAHILCGDAHNLGFIDDKFDFVIALEVLDDLPATLVRKNGNLEAVRMKWTSYGIGTYPEFFPLEECEDKEAIRAYADRNRLDINGMETDTEVTIHLGMERCISELSRVLRPNGSIFIMDYMCNVDGVPDRSRGLRNDFRAYRRSNLTAVIDYEQLEGMLRGNGFVRIEFVQIPTRIYDSRYEPSPYNYFMGIWQKQSQS